jgi:hypothetical protein
MRRLFDHSLETFYAGGGQGGAVEDVDGLHLAPQRMVDFVDAADVGDGPEIVAHQQVKAVSLQDETHPAVMLLTAQIC